MSLSTWLQYLVDHNIYSDEEMIDISVKLLKAMVAISGSKELLLPLKSEILEEFLKQLLTTLISPTVRAKFPNKRFIITKLNSITLSVLQYCDKTDGFYILLKFLKSAQPFPADKETNRLKSKPFSNLVVKCLAKLQLVI